jgi:putative tryptophan/tyrosine transport system substrate-binding protein
MRRREFIAGLGGAAVAWPPALRAQQPAMPVVGFLHLGAPDAQIDRVAGFRQGLKEAGYLEGQNVVVEYRWANGQVEQIRALAADLVRRRVAAILAGGGDPSAVAAKAATSDIPIVFAFGTDPVKLGLVASLNRPGGNVTGVTVISNELGGKRLDLLRQLVPDATTVGYLTAPGPNNTQLTYEEIMSEMTTAARALGRQLVVVETPSEADFEAAFATLEKNRAGALVVGGFALFTNRRDKLLPLVARYKIPAIYQSREFPLDGGLMSYGGNYVEAFRLGGIYIGRILNGAKPADLPVQQSTKFELLINLKTARALGLEIPPNLLAIADQVIE